MIHYKLLVLSGTSSCWCRSSTSVWTRASSSPWPTSLPTCRNRNLRSVRCFTVQLLLKSWLFGLDTIFSAELVSSGVWLLGYLLTARVSLLYWLLSLLSSLQLKTTWLEWQEHSSQLQNTTDALPCHFHVPACLWIVDPHSRAGKKMSHASEVLLQDTTHLMQRPC